MAFITLQDTLKKDMYFHSADGFYSHLIKEMSPPQLIGDQEFGLDNPTKLSNITYKFLHNNEKKLMRSINKDIKLYKLRNQFILIDEKQPTLLYIARYKTDYSNLIGTKYALQFMIWKGSYSPSQTKNISKNIFFNYILPLEGSILTDSQHTDLGKRFWLNRIGDAFSLKLNVYYVDFNRHILRKINNDNELNSLIAKDQIWGHDIEFGGQRMLITKKVLTEK